MSFPSTVRQGAKRSQFHRFVDSVRNPILSVEIRGIRRRVRGKQFEFAMKCELIEFQVLTSQQIHILLGAADLRLQVMIVLSCCLGLRPSEVLGLQWQDIDFARGSLAVSRSITGRHVADTKTEDSEAEVFLDSKITALLLRWKDQCFEIQQPWLFANVDTGRPFHADSLRQDYLRPLGRAIGIPNLGWYALRHTYRTLLDDMGTPIGVQQRLMRHSDVRTTMNIYGSAYEESKRQANEGVAGKLLTENPPPATQKLLQ